MPIPVHHNTLHVFTQIVDIISFARLGSHSNTCLINHKVCCLDTKSINEQEQCCIVMNILQKDSDILLERWIMSFDREEEEIPLNDSLLFSKNISNFIQHMPAKIDFIEMYTIATLNNNTSCHSYNSTQERIEFRANAHLKAQRFYLPSLSLEVVYDENATHYYKKKPIISLQSLSSPSFMSWSKIHQQQTTVEEEGNSSHIPMIAVRRLSRLSLSAMEDDAAAADDDDDEIMQDLLPLPQTTIPIPSPRMQYTTLHSHGHLCTTVAYSTSPINQHHHIPTSSPLEFNNRKRNSISSDHGCLVGSFEESLLSGRMSSMPSKPITFHCQIGVLGHGNCKSSLKCPQHWSIVFPAMFYNLGDHGGLPYVGTIDISEYILKNNLNYIGYRIPPKGQLQVVIKNPNKTAVKLFLIPYDFNDMPKNTKTFLRQKSYSINTPQQILKYAIHIQVCRNEKKRIYLYKSIRIVFANRKADSREKFNIVCEGPKEPVYVPI